MNHLVILIMLVAMVPPATDADDNMQDFRGGFIIGSEHWFSTLDDEKWNEQQNGIYLCYQNICGGRYKNSFSNVRGNPDLHSNFIQYEYYLGAAGIADFTAAAGFMDGYKGYNTNHNISPMVGLSIRMSIVKVWQIGRSTVYGIELW